ncbi:MAG: BTAD domain-containing putative transcriptional regulator [Actinomycetota bacterium]
MRISLLGRAQVEVDQSRRELGGNKPQLVLAALVLARGRVVSTDRLVEVIWGDNPPQKPYVAVRSYVSHLRRAIEPESRAGDRQRLLVTRSPGYALEIEADAVDAFRFETAVAAAGRLMEDGRHQQAAERLDDAMALWRSDDLSDSPLSLFVGEAEQLLERRRQAIAMHIDARLALGRHEEVIPELRSRLEDAPTDQRHLGQLMVALHRAHRSADALQAYQAGTRAIVAETGLDPSAGLAELERRILLNDPTLDWAPDRLAAPSQPAAGTVGDPPVGREDEAGVIVSAMERPSGGLVALTGEPGIGKSELLRHGAGLARSIGQTVIWGFGHADTGSTPLAPWRAMLGEVSARVDDATLADLVGDHGPELARLAPAIATRLGIEPADARDPHSQHDAVARFFRNHAAVEPLVLCLDDLHWFDDASLGMLSYAVPTFADQPLTVLAAWRDTEPLDDDRSAALATIGRLAADRRLALDGLGEEAVGRLWAGRAAGPTPIDSDAVAELRRRTAGNPLFITELLRSSSDLGDLAANATIDDVIATRLASIPEPARQLLHIGALCPGGFGERLLAELSGLDDDTLLDHLELLLASRLIEEDPVDADRFHFTHSLIGESLASAMSGVRKARLHTRIAESLAREQGSIDQLAHHLLRGATAGDPVAAANQALSAAGEAARLHDHTSAIDLIERGLAVLERSDDDQLRSKLMIELSQERKHKEHYTQSHAAAKEAFRLAKRAGDGELMVRAALSFCGQGREEQRFGISWLGYWNPPGPALDMLDDCLEKLPAGPLRVVVLIAYASQLFGEYDNPPEAAIILDEAVAEARLGPHRELLSAALGQRLFTLQRHLGFEQRRETIEELLALADDIGTPERIVAANRALTVLRLDRDDMAGARATIEVCRDALRSDDDASLALFADSIPIALDLYQGRVDAAEAAIQAAMITHQRVGAAALDLLGIQYATLLRERGRLSEVEELMRWKVTGYPGPAYGTALAMVLAEQGKTEEAENTLADFGGQAIETGGEGVLQFMTSAFYAETVMTLGDRDRAATLYRAMSGAADRVITMYSGVVYFGSGSLYLGRLATLLDRHDEAADHLAAAARHHEAVGSAPYQLRTILARRDLALATGRPVDGFGPDELTAEAERLAAATDLAWLVDRPITTS